MFLHWFMAIPGATGPKNNEWCENDTLYSWLVLLTLEDSGMFDLKRTWACLYTYQEV